MVRSFGAAMAWPSSPHGHWLALPGSLIRLRGRRHRPTWTPSGTQGHNRSCLSEISQHSDHCGHQVVTCHVARSHSKAKGRTGVPQPCTHTPASMRPQASGSRRDRFSDTRPTCGALAWNAHLKHGRHREWTTDPPTSCENRRHDIVTRCAGAPLTVSHSQREQSDRSHVWSSQLQTSSTRNILP